ncbi:MAG: dihydroxy-acid dehydratase, partial [Clostridia bacterium]|nr:dihydroxy-acid dehydratase [Clostridia bacterium]
PGRQIAIKNGQPALLTVGVFHLTDAVIRIEAELFRSEFTNRPGLARHAQSRDVSLSSRRDRRQFQGLFAGRLGADVVLGNIFAEGLSGHGHAIQMEKTGTPPGDGAQDGVNTPGVVDVLHVIVAARRDPADVGSFSTQFINPPQVVIDLRFFGHRHDVEHRVGASPHRHVENHRVVDGFCGDDLPGQQAVARTQLFELPYHFHNPLGRTSVETLSLRTGGEERAVGGECDAQGLAQAVHAVGGEHSGARTAGGTAEACIGHISPEAAAGGPIALLEPGDM